MIKCKEGVVKSSSGCENVESDDNLRRDLVQPNTLFYSEKLKKSNEGTFLYLIP